MKVSLIVIGKTDASYLSDAITEYKNRLVHYIPFEMLVIPDIKNVKNLSENQQKEKEGELILKALQPGDCLVLLDEHGKEFTSLQFASYMEKKMHNVGGGEDFAEQNDLLPPDDSPHLYRTALPRDDYPPQRTLSS